MSAGRERPTIPRIDVLGCRCCALVRLVNADFGELIVKLERLELRALLVLGMQAHEVMRDRVAVECESVEKPS